MAEQDATATAYVELKYGRFRSPYCRPEMRVVKATQNKPETVDVGCIVVKVKLRVPVAAFQPFEPTAEIVVPPELIQHEISAEATS